MSVKMLTRQFELCGNVVDRIADGLTHSDSLVTPAKAGNCANWILGHILDSRISILKIIGLKPAYDDNKFARYRRGSKPLDSSDESLPFEELVDNYKSMQATFMGELGKMTEDRLETKTEHSPFNNPDETIGSMLAFFAFHETYHVGQAALMRRVAGKPGPVG